MLGLKRVMCLAAMLTIAPASFIACNEDEDEETTTGGVSGDDAGLDTDGGDVDGGDADGGETDAGLEPKPAP